jgi:hypothetical protein
MLVYSPNCAMLHDDPLAWDRQIKVLADFDDPYKLTLRTDPESADPSGPFLDVPPLTERAAFVRLRGLPEDLPLRAPLLRWAYHLAESRINAAIQVRLARFWRSTPINLEYPQRIVTTRSQILLQLLRESQGRAQWLTALGDLLPPATQWVSELWQRRDELAKRAGFEGVQAVVDPVDGMRGFVDGWLGLTGPLSSEALPRGPVQLLEAALALRASRGWPARISAQSIASLLGHRSWLNYAHVREPTWPQLVGPTSFARALYRLGQELARAWAPREYPFVIRRDPWHLFEHRLGSLVASLVVNGDWQRRVLHLNNEQARTQVREFTRTLLQASRCLCLNLRLRPLAIQSSGAMQDAFAGQTTEVFGLEWPNHFAGNLPRLGFDDAQRLLAIWLGLSDHARLIEQFDEDWYRNPRAIESVRGQWLEIHQLAPTSDRANEAVRSCAAWLVARWS